MAASARILALLVTSLYCCMAWPALPMSRLKAGIVAATMFRKLLRKRASCKFLIASIYGRHVDGSANSALEQKGVIMQCLSG